MIDPTEYRLGLAIDLDRLAELTANNEQDGIEACRVQLEAAVTIASGALGECQRLEREWPAPWVVSLDEEPAHFIGQCQALHPATGFRCRKVHGHAREHGHPVPDMVKWI